MSWRVTDILGKELNRRLGAQVWPLERLHGYILAALFLQILFWYFATPGPQLADRYEPSFQLASQSCLIAALLLLVAPVGLILISRDSLARFGIGLGDVKFGLSALVALGPIAVCFTWLGSSDAQLQAFYPLPGDEFCASWTGLLLWFLVCSVYYISFEFFYRGFLLRGPTELGPRACFLLQWSCYVLVHLGKPMAETMASVPAGLVFAWVAIRSRSIWYVVVIHWLIAIANDLGVLWQAESGIFR